MYVFTQVHKENAPECLTAVHYTELHDKGVILMRGDYDKVLNCCSHCGILFR